MIVSDGDAPVSVVSGDCQCASRLVARLDWREMLNTSAGGVSDTLGQVALASKVSQCDATTVSLRSGDEGGTEPSAGDSVLIAVGGTIVTLDAFPTRFTRARMRRSLSFTDMLSMD